MTEHGNGLSRRDFLVQTALVTSALTLAPSSFAFAKPELATSRKGMVTSPHTLATEAGLKVLEAGGNAAEAAIAMGAVISVTYPHFTGIGGDAIWMVADRDGNKTVLMGVGQAPEKLPEFPGKSIPRRGRWATVSTACAVDAWNHAFEYSRKNWGGKQSFASLLDRAIGHAENGFPVSSSQAYWLGNLRDVDLSDWSGFKDVFMPGGKVPTEGETFVQKQLAESLKLIAKNGPREFYEGELAARIAKGLEAAGSPVTLADLKKTAAKEQDPISVDYRGLTLLAPPPPTQGSRRSASWASSISST